VRALVDPVGRSPTAPSSAFQPLIAVGLSVSGGVDSYLGPISAPRGTAIRGVKE
jgi:hypothetical protein